MTTNNYDFQVKWNPDVTGVINYPSSSIDTVESATEILCDIQRTNNSIIPATSDYSAISGIGNNSLNTVSGFAKTGAQIFNALDANNLDAVENEW